ncbi:MAG: Ig-like domain-containing protein [Planctomycetes bacterium]|nr:Ig-like domain-containing protein [Planctomycetota bacterium]
MHHQPFLIVLLALVLAGPLAAQATGPDLRVTAIAGIQNYPHDASLGFDAFAFGTTVCNLGDQDLDWVAGTSNHPVIGYQIYRLLNGRFESIGMSWARHPFFAASQNACGPCNGSFGSLLGAGCSDFTSAALAGMQLSFGPRSEIAASTVLFPFPPASPPITSALDRRLQVALADLGQPGARYFAEALYLSAAETLAGHALDNASWHEVGFQPSGGGFDLQLIGSTTVVGEPAILAWKSVDPQVQVTTVDIPGDGRVFVALRARELGPAHWRIDVAVQNLNSHEGISSLVLDRPAGSTILNSSSRVARHHSGEMISNAPWVFRSGSSLMSWDTVRFSIDPNSSAVRWGNLHAFSVETTTPPGLVISGQLKTHRSATSHPFSVTLPHRITVLSGQGQAANPFEAFAQPVRVRVDDAHGQPVANQPVAFAVDSGPGVITGSSMVTTNALGEAQLQVQAAGVAGTVAVSAAIPDDRATVALEVRKLLTQFSPALGLLTLALETELPLTPTVLAADVPGVQIPTNWGVICTTALTPAPTLFMVSSIPGVGSFDARLTTSMTGDWLVQVPDLALLGGTGFTLVFQAYAVASTGAYISNCVSLTF